MSNQEINNIQMGVINQIWARMVFKAQANIWCSFPSRISGADLTEKVILSLKNPKMYFHTLNTRLRSLTKKLSHSAKLYINDMMTKVFYCS